MAILDPKGPEAWSGSRDSEGHRTYKIRWLVHTEVGEGPADVMEAAGMPIVGSMWNFGVDVDVWAWCLPDMQVAPKTPGETCTIWTAEQTFSTKPPAVNRCADQTITNPILIPPEISGDFVKYNLEATKDLFGNDITNSALERIRGPEVEFDQNRQSIKIEMNFAALNLPFVTAMIDTLNVNDLWGFPARTIKLSRAPWQRKFYGSCYVYYRYTFEFDVFIRPDGSSGFDRHIQDDGTKVLNGHWGNGPGTGCTVTITVSNGGIITATLVAGGSGYPPNRANQLIVSGGTGGMVKAFANSSGVITDVSQLRAGKNYTAGTKATTTGSGWVVDYIDGAPPNQFDPTHFNQYKDKKGENATVVLNGAGLPAFEVLGPPLGQPEFPFISIVSIDNLNKPLTNVDFWIQRGVGPTLWNDETTYSRGDVVNVITVLPAIAVRLFILVASTSFNDYPPDNSGPGVWTELANGINEKGYYDTGTIYVTGDSVLSPLRLPEDSGCQGDIFVQFYPESDFLLLGIPASLE